MFRCLKKNKREIKRRVKMKDERKGGLMKDVQMWVHGDRLRIKS